MRTQRGSFFCDFRRQVETRRVSTCLRKSLFRRKAQREVVVLADGGKASGLLTRRRGSLLRRKAQREEGGCGFGEWGEGFGVVHTPAKIAFAEEGAEGGERLWFWRMGGSLRGCSHAGEERFCGERRRGRLWLWRMGGRLRGCSHAGEERSCGGRRKGLDAECDHPQDRELIYPSYLSLPC